jgi:hypothetical protein
VLTFTLPGRHPDRRPERVRFSSFFPIPLNFLEWDLVMPGDIMRERDASISRAGKILQPVQTRMIQFFHLESSPCTNIAISLPFLYHFADTIDQVSSRSQTNLSHWSSGSISCLSIGDLADIDFLVVVEM